MSGLSHAKRTKLIMAFVVEDRQGVLADASSDGREMDFGDQARGDGDPVAASAGPVGFGNRLRRREPTASRCANTSSVG